MPNGRYSIISICTCDIMRLWLRVAWHLSQKNEWRLSLADVYELFWGLLLNKTAGWICFLFLNWRTRLLLPLGMIATCFRPLDTRNFYSKCTRPPVLVFSIWGPRSSVLDWEQSLQHFKVLDFDSKLVLYLFVVLSSWPVWWCESIAVCIRGLSFDCAHL